MGDQRESALSSIKIEFTLEMWNDFIFTVLQLNEVMISGSGGCS